MKTNKFFLMAALLFWICSGVRAQTKDEILITTKPPGATVYLDGDFELVANTPARLPADISGRYKAKITRPGYETWKGELTFVPGSPNQIEIRLTSKTRFKAFVRSFFIPGWGQRYSGNTTRGTLIMSASVVSAASIIVTDRIYSTKSKEYDVALADFNNASSIDEKNRLKLILNSKQRDAYDAETNRNAAIAIGIAGWAFNILDALVFFPESDVFYPTVTSLGDGVSITLTARF